jgi:hypothetical protein
MYEHNKMNSGWCVAKDYRQEPIKYSSDECPCVENGVYYLEVKW